MSVSKSDRIHGIDALRAITMILGMLLHATIAYKVEPIPTWPTDPAIQHWSFDALYMFLHSFRMPLFFMVGGFFCRLLYFKIGERAFIVHRYKRIFLPFVFSVILILPLTIFPFSVFKYMQEYPGQWQLIFSKSFTEVLHWNGFAHLWFLYYLLIFYFTVIVSLRIIRLFENSKPILFFKSFVSKFTPGSLSGILILVAFTWLILLMVHEEFLHVDTGILPHPAYLLYYLVFFITGWFVQKKPFSLKWMTSNSMWLFLAGATFAISIFIISFFYQNTALEFRSFLKIIIAFEIVLLVYGITGLFLRYFKSESPFWKYISDASYWMYLIHLTIVASLQVSFMAIDLPAMLRFPLVLFATLFLSLISYHFLIRYSIIGTYLHGPRKNK